jgi:HEAT repeat protein
MDALVTNRLNLLLVAISVLLTPLYAQTTSTQPTRKEAIEMRRKAIEADGQRWNSLIEKHYEKALKDQHIPTTTAGLIAALKNSDSDVRVSAAFLLQKHSESSAIPALQSLLKDSDPTVAVSVALDLAKLNDSSGFNVVMQGTKNTSLLVRQMAVGAILEFAKFPEQKSNVVDTLEKALGDESKDVRLTAAAGLAIISDPATIPALKAAQGKEPDATTRMILSGHLSWLEYVQSLKP